MRERRSTRAVAGAAASLRLLAILAMLLASVAVASDDGGDYPAVIAHERPMIGLYPSDVPAQVAEREGLPPGTGVLVVGIIPGSAAERMGLHGGDVILTFNGRPVSSYAEIVAARDQYSAGDLADIRFSRGGNVLTASAPLGTWNTARGSRSRPSPAPEIDPALVDRLRELVEDYERAHPGLAETDADRRERLSATSDAVASGAWRFTAELSVPASADVLAPRPPSSDEPAADRLAGSDTGAWRLAWRCGAR